MKLTGVLYKQHIGRQLKKLWYVKRERKVNDTKIERQLSKLGIEVKDSLEMINPKQEFPKYFFSIKFCIFCKFYTA